MGSDFADRVRIYRANRPHIPAEALEPHSGKWAAISADGRRVVTSANEYAELERRLVEIGQDSQEVVVEFLGPEEICLGGAELG
jgi:hypothetical protein